LGTRVTKYYHTAKIRDEKRGTEHTIFYVETPQQIRGKNHGARVENLQDLSLNTRRVQLTLSLINRRILTNTN
jgi:hypothetical protein